MKKIETFILMCLVGVCLTACDDDDDNVTPNPDADYTYKCDFLHPFSGLAACKGLVGVTTEAQAEKFCAAIAIGGASPEPPATMSKGKCDLDYNGYCIGPDGVYTFSVKSPGAEVVTDEDDCNPDVNLSAAWGCEEGPKLNNEPVGTFVCTI